MSSYSLSHLSDQTLLRDLAALVSKDRAITAALLAHIAEVDARRLYVPAGYPSMYVYCVQELRLSEEAARKRIHAARAARRVPALFAAVAEGRLHLSAVILIAPYLTPENAGELLEAATHKTKFEIAQLIVERFPKLDMPALVQAMDEPPIEAAASTDERAPGRVDQPEPTRSSAPGQTPALDPRPRVAPLAPQRFSLQLTMGQELHDKLRYAQELLSHQVPSGDVAQVLERALDALIDRLEKRKFAATSAPRHRPQPPPATGRHVPAHVRRAVWERDGGRCTFVSEAGHRCRARRFLEFDHIEAFARGGQASVEGMRLRCRAHNQYQAERTFGVEFMRRKRQEAQQARAARAQAGRARTSAEAQEVIPWLRALGFRVDEAHRAAERCEAIPDAPLEERVRLALTCFRP